MAAVEPLGDVPLLWRAADILGIEWAAAGPAEEAGLLTIGTRVQFRHPLVRSATRRAAATKEVRAAHQALAEATNATVDLDRRTWHRCYATAAPDEAVAGELDEAAGRARRRGGYAAAAALLERAMELTPSADRIGSRAVAAAFAKLFDADNAGGLELVAAAELYPLTELERGVAGVRLGGARRWVSTARPARGCWWTPRSV